jgi:LuxR family maltose regulon positive regulatory protein
VIATNNQAVGQLWAGRLDEAESNLLAVQERCRELGIGLTELSVHGHLALLDVIHGRLPAAAQRAGAALGLAGRRGWIAEPQALALRAAIAMVDLEQGRFRFCDNVDELADTDEPSDSDVACRLVLAIVYVDHANAQRDGILADQAIVRLEGVQAQAGRLPPLLAGWCTAARAAADLTSGRWSEAIDRVRTADPSAYPDALGRIVLAKARLLLDQPQQTIDALQPMLRATPRFRGPAVEARVLAAIAAERLHRNTAALGSITEAIGLAQGAGMIRPFLAAAPQIASLLSRHRHVVARHLEFTGQLSAAITGDSFASSGGQFLEPLTGRERAVLAYLPTMLKSAEIAAEMFVSVNTVKTHQRAIYRKLGVGNRREAVDKARALNFLEQPDRPDLGHVRGRP